MTYASDALNAFSGILSVLSHCSGQKFFWAHMISVFERQLYWVGKAKMRSSIQSQLFPTWSWVGWVGEISFRHFDYYEPAVTCFTIEKDAAGRVTGTKVVCSQPTDLNNSPQLQAKSKVTQEEIEAAFDTGALLPGSHLFFYTYSATFYLTPQGRLVLPDRATRYILDERGLVLGPRPDYGLLLPSLDDNQLYDNQLCDKGYRECILLGSRQATSAYNETHTVVMLVTRIRGVAYRVGIADMLEDVWNLADKKWELIALG
jgi:hypothetical protein